MGASETQHETATYPVPVGVDDINVYKADNNEYSIMTTDKEQSKNQHREDGVQRLSVEADENAEKGKTGSSLSSLKSFQSEDTGSSTTFTKGNGKVDSMIKLDGDLSTSGPHSAAEQIEDHSKSDHKTIGQLENKGASKYNESGGLKGIGKANYEIRHRDHEHETRKHKHHHNHRHDQRHKDQERSGEHRQHGQDFHDEHRRHDKEQTGEHRHHKRSHDEHRHYKRGHGQHRDKASHGTTTLDRPGTEDSKILSLQLEGAMLPHEADVQSTGRKWRKTQSVLKGYRKAFAASEQGTRVVSCFFTKG